MEISFIISIYKVNEKYLIALIDSFNNQAHHGMFECIFIIDEVNSIADYKKLIDNLNSDISCLIVQNEVNLGSGDARNVGICHAKGEYVIFVGADDNMSEDYVYWIANQVQISWS